MLFRLAAAGVGAVDPAGVVDVEGQPCRVVRGARSALLETLVGLVHR
ncbi:hypothetical protein [Prescottella equi]|uniref:Uncharacterized protein n=1 Tax=Rhodococcus hoagii TaxID=43767 RepID=A0A9Q4ZSP3_RHOHA|nr:hypothetical protein [Prescottella equi]MBM4479822.1 hypothetical protein [Prescottella equi]MBM4487700.1 hypothetical protein [Prescottella equi]MBM4498354.1 hypothetical protein [Prescottella equi]MBM4538850.1 hypothetical protein [Prescottella equi]MBM4548079.1 hypothetical protein [Prescottella equi]